MDLHPLNHVRHVVPFVESLGLRVRFIGDAGIAGHVTWSGMAPSTTAYLVAPDLICVRLTSAANMTLPDAPHVIHEAMHLLCGPESLEDELPAMMGEAWILRSHAGGLVRNVMRREFSRSAFDWTNPRSGVGFTMITSCNDVWKSEEWLGASEWAVKAGILQADGSLALRGPHPDWSVAVAPT